MRELTATRIYRVDKEEMDKTSAMLFRGILILRVVACVQVILPIVPSSLSDLCLETNRASTQRIQLQTEVQGPLTI